MSQGSLNRKALLRVKLLAVPSSAPWQGFLLCHPQQLFPFQLEAAAPSVLTPVGNHSCQQWLSWLGSVSNGCFQSAGVDSSSSFDQAFLVFHLWDNLGQLEWFLLHLPLYSSRTHLLRPLTLHPQAVCCFRLWKHGCPNEGKVKNVGPYFDAQNHLKLMFVPVSRNWDLALFVTSSHTSPPFPVLAHRWWLVPVPVSHPRVSLLVPS